MKKEYNKPFLGIVWMMEDCVRTSLPTDIEQDENELPFVPFS